MKSRLPPLIGMILAIGSAKLRAEPPPTASPGTQGQRPPEQTAVGPWPSQPRLPFRIVRDVAYLGSNQPEKLDLYLPSPDRHDSSVPAVIWMHGDHHDKGDAREHNVCETLAGAGYVCASINYGTWTDSDNDPAAAAHDRQNLANAKAAVRFLRVRAAEYRIDPSRIAAFGGSAGAYLALMLGFTNDDPEFSRLGPYEGVSSAVEAVGDFYGDYEPAMMARITSRFPRLSLPRERSTRRWTTGSPPCSRRPSRTTRCQMSSFCWRTSAMLSTSRPGNANRFLATCARWCWHSWANIWDRLLGWRVTRPL